MKKFRIILISLVVILITMLVVNSNIAYAISLKNDMTNYVLKNISGDNIVTFRSIYDDPDKLKEGLLYCIRGKKIFPSNTQYNYSEYKNLKTESSDVILKYNELNSVNLDRIEEIRDSKNTSYNVNIYNSILWIMDNSYLPKDNGNYVASEYREELLNKIKLETGNVDVKNVTDTELEIAQQAALWFFTDYDTKDQNLSFSFQTTRDIADYIYLNDSNDWTNQGAVSSIYNYFIDNALKNSDIYGTTNPREVTVIEPELEKGDTSSEVTITKGDKAYYVGPFKLDEKVSGNIDYTLTTTLMVGKNELPEKSGGVSSYTITKDTSSISTYTSIKDAIGKGNFYIRIPNLVANSYNVASSIISLKVEYNFDYYQTTEKMLLPDSDTQEIVLIERDKIEGGDPIEWTTARFDLALRKYIVKVNGVELTGDDSRVPTIDKTNLNKTATTASYKHKKNAVAVKTGETITYRIATYNEGDIDGYVYSIKDYIPEYLEFVSNADFISKDDYDELTSETAGSVTAKYVYDYDETNHVIEITRYANPYVKTGLRNNLWGLEAYDGVNIDSEYIDLTFKIKESFVPEKDTYLTNVATMTYGDTLVGNSNLSDRDSQDSTFTEPRQTDYVSESETTYKGNSKNKTTLDDSTYHYEGQQDDDDFEKIVVKGVRFDLSLRKFITKVDDKNVEPSREPKITINDLKSGNDTTAKYVHPKNTLTFKRGNVITYTIRVYNEGNVDGKVTEITDYLPEGLELVSTADTSKYNWTTGTPITIDGKTVTPITTDYLKNNTLKAYDTTKISGDSQEWSQATDDQTGLYYFDVQVACKIKDTVVDSGVLKNIAEITRYEGGIDKDNEAKVIDDSKHIPESETNGYTPGEEDDDDFEKITVESQVFDLALRKYITGLQSGDGLTKSIVNKDGTSNIRSLTNINTQPLLTGSTTASYKHRKDAVVVETGDIVEYTLKVYNEGEIDGYVTEIKDILPEGLEFIEPTTTINVDFAKEDAAEKGSAKYTYTVADGVLTIKCISGKEAGTVFEKLTAFDGTNLDCEEIKFKCKVTASVGGSDKILTNIARITADKADAVGDKNDRDSEPETFTTPSDLSSYKGTTTETDLSKNDIFYTGQQDDDDFEKLIILGKKFDLSLRKFITKINGEEVETSREPKLDMTTLENNTKTTARYEHSKESIVVKQGDIVTYTIRVYNEGERDGYATEVTDYLPEGLGLIVGYKTNVNNNWALKAGTTAKKLSEYTDVYNVAKNNLQLSDFAETEAVTSLDNVQIVTGKVAISSTLLKDKELKAYDTTKTTKTTETEHWQKALEGKGTTGLYYEDIEVTCIVLASNTYKGTLKNIAAITGAKDTNGTVIQNVGDDRDSEPNQIDESKYHNSVEDNGYWPGEQDDDDFEPLVLQYFDLALRKFITGVNNTQITSRYPQLSIDSKTGNIKYTHPKEESPVEVACNDEVTYTLRIYNEGTKAGYADLVADDIPEGLEFLPENTTNKEYRWVMYKYIGEDIFIPQSTNITDKIAYIDGKYYEETNNPSEADVIRTDYLSKEQGAERMKTGDTENPALLSAFDQSKIGSTNTFLMEMKTETDKERLIGEIAMHLDENHKINLSTFNPTEFTGSNGTYKSKYTGLIWLVDENGNITKSGETIELSDGNPDYADIKVVFKVTEPNRSDRIIVNSAQIVHDTDDKGREVDDEDSETNKWNNGEDDQDKEYIKVKYFDLSLYKWVTKSIVNVDGTTTTTETGFTPNIGKTINITGMDVRDNEEGEPIAAVTLDKKKLDSTTVWFAYNIMVMNEGEIAGSATEITDYIPDGLEFVEEDNYAFGWEDAGNGKITTRCLDGLVLQPGESATIEVVFRWINSADNLGLKTNIAEISEDYNENGAKDIDSTPDNKYDTYSVEQEDDDDFALVILQLKTGSAPTYIAITTAVLAILSGGIILIKKYVL